MTAGLSSREQDRLVDLSGDTALKLIFSQTHLTHFWMHVNMEYTDLSPMALMFLLRFATTYLCDTGFSALVALKTKYRNRLDFGPDLRLKWTSIQPELNRSLDGGLWWWDAVDAVAPPRLGR